ncbi:MAG: NYN domain-containing protein [bacterium]
MDRVAVFVDAGYLYAQGSSLLAGKKLPRGCVVVNYLIIVKELEQFAKTLTDLSLLRIYWYDGTSTGPSTSHLTLAHLDNVKVRLGFVNSVGEQKGVDSLIVTDMITLSRNHAVADIVLLSGDEDLRVGVQQAQEFGVRIHLIGIKPSRGSQSLFLLQEADTTHEWDKDMVTRFVSIRADEITGNTTSAKTEPLQMPQEPLLDLVAHEVFQTIPKDDISSILATYKQNRQIPAEQDKLLLGKCRSRLGHDLNSLEKRTVREAFYQVCLSTQK